MVHLIQAYTITIKVTGNAQKMPEVNSNECVIKNRSTSVNPIYIGGENVTSDKGLELMPGESTDELHVPLLSEIFYVGTAGDKFDIFVYDNPVLDALNELLVNVANLKGSFVSAM